MKDECIGKEERNFAIGEQDIAINDIRLSLLKQHDATEEQRHEIE